MSSFLYKKSGMEFSSIPESVYPKKAVFDFLRELIEEDKHLELAKELKDNDKAILKVIWK